MSLRPFAVVDQKSRQLFEYQANGELAQTKDLSKENKKGRGLAISADGNVRWVVDSDAEVYVYDRDGALLGIWKAEGIDKPKGSPLMGKGFGSLITRKIKFTFLKMVCIGAKVIIRRVLRSLFTH